MFEGFQVGHDPPLVEQTRHLINSARIGLMKNTAVLLNFSRGGIVEEAAVLHALEAGKLRAYVCDFPNSALLNRKG
ncbi:MAG TPA: NAD(P)-dependent oxidoreductase [Methylococcaceae bacterium]|nr:NAD(P)-dependent oxidoreductase [Methylococcaceae bacterium]